MSKSNKITYTRFVYSIINFFDTECQLPFDVSSYIQNDDNSNCRIANLKIVKFIELYRKRKSYNKLFLTISFKDEKNKQKGREIIRLVLLQS